MTTLRFQPRSLVQSFEINAERQFFPLNLAAADFNRDGNLDLVSNGFYLFLGKGDGSFTAVELPADLQQLLYTKPAVADLNRDGNPDLISLGSEMQTWLGDGKGGFIPAQTIPVGPTSQSASQFLISDLNGDRNPDAVVVQAGKRDQPSTQSVSLLLGNGTGFSNPQPLPVKGRPLDAIAGDFNGDGKRDLVLLNTVSNGSRSTQQLTLLAGQGNGSFRTAGSSPIQADRFTQLVTGDFNRDGKTDLAVGAGRSVTVLLGSRQGLKQHSRFSLKSNLAENLTAGDFSGDGRLDLAITESDVGYTAFQVMQGDGRGNFGRLSRAFSASVDYDHSEEGNAYSALKGDFNGDGKLDLATADGASYTQGTVTVFLNQTPRGPVPRPRPKPGRSPSQIIDSLTGLEATAIQVGPASVVRQTQPVQIQETSKGSQAAYFGSRSQTLTSTSPLAQAMTFSEPVLPRMPSDGWIAGLSGSSSPVFWDESFSAFPAANPT